MLFVRIYTLHFNIKLIVSQASATELRDHSVPIRIGAMALPPFHAFAFYAQFACALFNSLTVALYPPVVTEPSAQPVMPTPDNILVHVQQTQSNCLTVVPAMLQAWSQSTSDIEALRSLEVVVSQSYSDNIFAILINETDLRRWPASSCDGGLPSLQGSAYPECIRCL